MDLEIREKEYRNIAMHLIQSLYMSGSNVIATLGFFIALSKKGRLFDYMDIAKFDYIYNETIQLDHDTTIGLYDVCGMVPLNSTVLTIVRVMDSIHDIDHARLFEEVIAIYASQEERKRDVFFQPNELTHLVSSILKENNAKYVYNPFAGVGSYQLDNKDVCYTSQELNHDTWIIGKLRMFMNDIYYDYTCEDSILKWAGENRKFDAVVATPPFKMLLSKEQESVLYWEDLGFRHKTVETLYFSRAITSIKEDGVVIGVVPSSFLSDTTYAARGFRQYFIENGLVREMIQLPANIFNATAISTAIVVLSKSSQNQIRFIDASECYTKRGKGNILDWEQIVEQRKHRNSENIRLVNNVDVSAQGYDLTPSRYFEIADTIHEGYEAIPLKDLTSIHTGDRHDSSEGHFVNIGDLSSDGLYSTVEIANLPFGELKSNFRRITSPVLLISKVRFLKPTYIEASPTNPIYISPNIIALSVDSTKVYIPYLAYELSLKSGRLHKGAVIPNFQRKDILNLKIAIPSLSSQGEVLSQERAIIESLTLADKNAKIKEHGLEEIIKMREQELFRLISLRKHRINPYFSGMQDNLVLLRDEFKTSGAITLNHKITPNYTVEELLNNFERQIADVKNLFKDLTSQLDIGKSKPFPFINFIQSYKYIGKNPNLNLVVEIRSDGSITDLEREIVSSESSLKELIDIVIENAERHAFIGRTHGSVDIRYGEDGDGIYIQILNDGIRLDKDFNEELSFSEGYKYGKSGNTGKGLFRAKQICIALGADISWITDDTSVFATGILISIKNV